MTIQTIHIELTSLQTSLLEKMRKHLPDYTEDDLQREIVAKGLSAIGADLPDDSMAEHRFFEMGSSQAPGQVERHVGDTITIDLNEDLRARLERLLRARPGIDEQEAFSTLIELGLSTLIELGTIRERDLAAPRGEP